MPRPADLGCIERVFNARFANWEIRLPRKDIRARRRGKIVKAGWAIWYLFGADENGEFLDYYASHRMTNDSHIRIREDGTTEGLPSIGGIRIVANDPEEDARQEAEYFRRNQEIAAMLAEKGFGPEGDEPGGVLINRYLHLGGSAEDDEGGKER